MEQLAPQGTGEQCGDKRQVGRPPAASPWMLCSGKGQLKQRRGQELGSLSGGLERGLVNAAGLGELMREGIELWGTCEGCEGHTSCEGHGMQDRVCWGCEAGTAHLAYL